MKSHETFLILQVRNNIRPHFLVSDSRKCVYDVITWATTQIAISYTVVPFVLLAVGSSLKFYRCVFHGFCSLLLSVFTGCHVTRTWFSLLRFCWAVRLNGTV